MTATLSAEPIHAHSLLKCCYEGYWYCQRCERVADGIDSDNTPPVRCPRCKKRAVVWMHPALTH